MESEYASSCYFRSSGSRHWLLLSCLVFISCQEEEQVHFLNFVFLFPYSYRPGSLDVSFIRSELALGTQEEWQKFESAVSLVYTDATKTKIDCKQSSAEAPAS